MAGESRTTQAGGAARLALVANPGSGSANPAACRERLRAFGAGVESFGVEEVERAAASGAERLVVAGGDGSVAPAAAAAAAAGIPLAVIPSGTANDFARRLGLPRDMAAACRLAVRGHRLRPLELGWIEPAAGEGERRPFVNAASTGLAVHAARRAHSWKRPLGELAYAAAAVVAGARERPLHCSVRCDGHLEHDGRAWQVTVACTGAFGGGSHLREADPGDGALDTVIVDARARTALVGVGMRLRRGDLTEHAAARHVRCAAAAVDVPPAAGWNVDGELLPLGAARFGVDAAAFELVTP